MKATIIMTGHGQSVEIDGGSWSGLPTYCTAPRAMRDTMEVTYRRIVGEGGGLSQAFRKSQVRQLSENVYVTTQAVLFSLYRVGADGVAREDESTRRVFRIYTKHDFN